MTKKSKEDMNTDLIVNKLDGVIAPVRKRLSEGEINVLNAKLIDMMSETKSLTELVGYTREYYLKTLGKSIANPYEVIQIAKNLWLSNLNLPSLENYKKDKFLKMEQLQDKISAESEKDIVDQAKVIVDINKYQDGIMGLDKDNNNDINIIIGTDRERTIKALELEED